MKIINKTNNSVIAEDVILANTSFKRIKGLLGEKEFKQGQAIIIKPCNSIHTFFMRFAIDVLFMDKQNRVVKAIHNLLPYRLTPIYFNAYYCIELPAGAIRLTNTQEGHEISPS